MKFFLFSLIFYVISFTLPAQDWHDHYNHDYYNDKGRYSNDIHQAFSQSPGPGRITQGQWDTLTEKIARLNNSGKNISIEMFPCGFPGCGSGYTGYIGGDLRTVAQFYNPADYKIIDTLKGRTITPSLYRKPRIHRMSGDDYNLMLGIDTRNKQADAENKLRENSKIYRQQFYGSLLEWQDVVIEFISNKSLRQYAENVLKEDTAITGDSNPSGIESDGSNPVRALYGAHILVDQAGMFLAIAVGANIEFKDSIEALEGSLNRRITNESLYNILNDAVNYIGKYLPAYLKETHAVEQYLIDNGHLLDTAFYKQIRDTLKYFNEGKRKRIMVIHTENISRSGFYFEKDWDLQRVGDLFLYVMGYPYKKYGVIILANKKTSQISIVLGKKLKNDSLLLSMATNIEQKLTVSLSRGIYGSALAASIDSLGQYMPAARLRNKWVQKIVATGVLSVVTIMVLAEKGIEAAGPIRSVFGFRGD